MWSDLGRPAFNFARHFAGFTRGQIAQGIGPQQTELLRQFFGTGVRGARAARRNFKIPEDLTRDALNRYHEIARRVINKGLDTQGVQRLRLRLVEKALRELDKLGGGTR